jgi:multidrug efflux pump subunit AcrB
MLDENSNAIAISRQMEHWMDEYSQEWPIGYSYEIGGEMETSAEANQSIADKLPIAGLIIVLLLVTQFNSIRKPAIILLTIPLGLIGVVIGLIVARSYFGFMTLLGVVSLAGIVINNAIVLLERIKLEIEQNGFEPQRAIVEAAQRRMRPILLTTMTTMLGLLPLWFGGSTMFQPMAIAIIFGLLFATTLTLGVIPVLYSVLFRIKYKGYTYNK